MMQFFLRNRALFLVSIFGTVAMLFATRNGMSLLPFDSMTYLNTARNILSGHGFYENNYDDFGRTAMTHYAPLYPAVLALISAFGVEPMSAARLLNSLLFGANIFCIGIAIRAITSSRKATLIGAILATMSHGLLTSHYFALSEPLFLFFFLLSVILLSRYMTSQKTITLAFSSVMLSFSFCTRYAGLALVVSDIAALLLLSSSTMRRRLIDSACVAVIGSAPTGMWIVRNALISGSPFDRPFSFRTTDLQAFMQGIHTVARWVFPGYSLPMVTIPLLSVCVLALAVLLFRPTKAAFAKGEYSCRRAVHMLAPDGMSRIFLLFIVVYPLFLLLSLCTFDHRTPFDMRILLPEFVSCLILGVGFCANALSRQWSSPAARALFLACICIVGSSYILTGLRWLTKDNDEYAYFLGKSSRSYGIISAVKKLPTGAMLFSNNPSILSLYCDNPACLVPWFPSLQNKIDLGADTVDVEKKLAVRRVMMKNMMQERIATVVWLDTIPFGICPETFPETQPWDSILAYYHLAPVLDCADGVLYHLAQ
jgi:Dolichyl-phosphate-mannose-protein mannosyltransferase